MYLLPSLHNIHNLCSLDRYKIASCPKQAYFTKKTGTEHLCQYGVLGQNPSVDLYYPFLEHINSSNVLHGLGGIAWPAYVRSWPCT
jgi:hypothetical protein